MKPNKHTTEMDAHLEAHPPIIEWGDAVKGVQHGTVIEEIPMPKKAPKPEEALGPRRQTCECVEPRHCRSCPHDAPEPRYMETLDEMERGGH